MVDRVRLSEQIIGLYKTDPTVKEIRFSHHPQLKLRYHQSRATASWLFWNKKLWVKIGTWPQLSAKHVILALPELSLALALNKPLSVSIQVFDTVGALLHWYQTRMQQHAHLSVQRHQDINSAINKHLLPTLSEMKLNEVNKVSLDQALIWPLQGALAKSTVAKYFAMLKAAFAAAYKLELITDDPLARMRIGDFGNFTQVPKEPRLFPVHVPALLPRLSTEPLWFQVLFLLQLTFGTRLKETLSARWAEFHLGEDGHWYLPGKHTKNSKNHHLFVPTAVKQLLLRWQGYLRARKESLLYVFPHPNGRRWISKDMASKQYRHFSGGQWSSHDVRKCARTCWAEQHVDHMIAEKLLNHSLGKVAETYLASHALPRQQQAIEAHVAWLITQDAHCYQRIDTESTPTLTSFNTTVNQHAA